MKKKEDIIKKRCITCNTEKVANTAFYMSNNDFHKIDKRFPVCKGCVKKTIDFTNLNTLYDILQQMNRPFLIEVWEAAISEAERNDRELFGLYLKSVLLNHKSLNWNDSVFDKNISDIQKSDDFNKNTDISFTVTREMIIRWGSNYEPEDYMNLEDFYTRMQLSNKIETPQEEAYLKKLAVISLKMDKELVAGKYSQVKQLGDLFSKYMADSKFRASDKTDADKSGGIRNFGTIYAEVEKDSHIPPWEEFRLVKNISQDLIDKTIMHIENFTLRLNKIERMTTPPDDTPKLQEELEQ
ncbi:hypothetical protein EBB07_29470 [Paenibacillaceae bacterium]|nr:hypothetical protein EBB07_29470 [Paenibacillaceae bacterium]